MRLSRSMADWLIDRFASRLNAGTLAIYAGAPPLDGRLDQTPLVELQFQAPAFMASVDSVAEAHPLPPAVVQATGEAGWAQLVTSSGEAIADVRVRAVDAVDAEIGDVLVDRTDFHRGGLCDPGRVTLTVPLRP